MGAKAMDEDGFLERFRVEVRDAGDGDDGGRAVVAPVGELDLATVGEVQRELDALVATGRHRVVLDLHDLRFIDSTGVRCLLDAHRTLAEHGGELTVIDGQEPVSRAFDVMGVRRILRFVDS